MRDGYINKRSREFEHTRLICYSLARCFSDPKHPLPSIDKFMPLPTDEVQVKESESELMQMRLRLVEQYNRVYGKNFTA